MEFPKCKKMTPILTYPYSNSLLIALNFIACSYLFFLSQPFIQWAEKQPQCNRLKLHDLLVKPMQRLTRYSLLLRAIHKKTDEENVKQDLMDMVCFLMFISVMYITLQDIKIRGMKIGDLVQNDQIHGFRYIF